ncbi:hypothetical protein GGX14DRAFT_401856 [Mycena pura]|uniref:Uncharacterized protein n=1 Tax=Mycena pura TaxID=153505 RepID=A0AAD6UZZ1_9AGAR|nr:hypothetical protein GGX14DRAFT_401856 [Mycena pura]
MISDIERREIMDAQRYDVAKRRTNRKNLNIQIGTNDSKDSSVTSRSNSPLLTPEGSWVSFHIAAAPSPEGSDSSDSPEGSNSASELSGSSPSAPPSSFVASCIAREDDIGDTEIRQTDMFAKDEFVVTRTIIRPTPRSPLGCFSRPSSPLPSRPSSPGPTRTRPLSPIALNFAALNCFVPSGFEADVDHLQAQRAREHCRTAAVQVQVHQLISMDIDTPWPLEQDNSYAVEGLRRRLVEPTATVSAA